MTEAIVLLIVLAVVVTYAVWSARHVLEALHAVTRALVTVHEREADRQKDLLDRLMARDFDHYKAYALAEGFPPATTEADEVPDEELRRQRPWITGPAEPEDTPEELLKDLEEAGA